MMKKFKSHNSNKIIESKNNRIYMYYTSWPIILSNMKAIRPTTSESCIHKAYLNWKCMKMLKSHNSYKNCRIKMAGLYDQLHIITNNPTIYECDWTNDFRGVAFTKWRMNEQTDKPKTIYAPIPPYTRHTHVQHFKLQTSADSSLKLTFLPFKEMGKWI
jgi:hypothetical protein